MLPNDCSKIIWSSGKTERFGLGPYLIADGKIFILSDDGILTDSAVDHARLVPGCGYVLEELEFRFVADVTLLAAGTAFPVCCANSSASANPWR